VDDLRSQVTGQVHGGDETQGFTELSECHTVADHAPVAVVRAENVEDVADALRWATRRGLGVAVHAAGHGSRSYRGAVVVSTRRMTAFSVDADSRTATVDAGVRWEAVIAAAAAHGLAPLNGSSPTVGVVG
jgi:FAD/FMN-containing dehydrogenase